MFSQYHDNKYFIKLHQIIDAKLQIHVNTANILFTNGVHQNKPWVVTSSFHKWHKPRWVTQISYTVLYFRMVYSGNRVKVHIVLPFVVMFYPSVGSCSCAKWILQKLGESCYGCNCELTCQCHWILGLILLNNHGFWVMSYCKLISQEMQIPHSRDDNCLMRGLIT